jgi:hypothetical protein
MVPNSKIASLFFLRRVARPSSSSAHSAGTTLAAPALIGTNFRQHPEKRPFVFSVLRNPHSQGRKFAHLFSYRCKTLLPEPPCFEIDTKPPGGLGCVDFCNPRTPCAFFSLLCTRAKTNPCVSNRSRAPSSLFCQRAKTNSCIFKRVRTILEK